MEQELDYARQLAADAAQQLQEEIELAERLARINVNRQAMDSGVGPAPSVWDRRQQVAAEAFEKMRPRLATLLMHLKAPPEADATCCHDGCERAGVIRCNTCSWGSNGILCVEHDLEAHPWAHTHHRVSSLKGF